MTTRETLKSFLSDKGVEGTSISYSLNNDDQLIETYSQDLGKDENTNAELLDLENSNTGLLGEYLSYITELSNNFYKIERNNVISSKTNRGSNLNKTNQDNRQGAQKVYVEDSLKNSLLDEYSNSKKFENENINIKDIIDKTGANPEKSEKLLKSILGDQLSNTNETLVNQDGEDNIVIQASQAMFKKYNRFANASNSTAFAPKNASTEQLNNSENKEGTFTTQKDLGVYEKESQLLFHNNLKKIASSMILKSTLYDNSNKPGESIDPDSINDDLIINSILNNDNYNSDGFKKIEVEKLRPKNSFPAPADEITGESTLKNSKYVIEDEDINISKNNFSFGSTYNSSYKSDSPNKKISIIKALIALKALYSLGENVYSQIISYFDISDQSNYVNVATEHEKGKYKINESHKINFIKEKIFVKTRYPYKRSFDRGLKVIYGDILSIEENISTQSSSNVKNSFRDSPDFWLAILNSTMKSYDKIYDSINNFIVSDISNSFEEKIDHLYKVLRENKVVNFYNAVATIGDKSLSYTNGKSLSSIISEGYDLPRDVDLYEDTPGNRISKSRKNSRTSKSKNQLNFAQNEVPAAYLLPVNVIRADVKMYNGNNPSPMRAMMGSSLAENTYLSAKLDGGHNRIPAEVVKKIEDQLDAEYVPFYIQDLRTNEIIAFHAFLDSLSDSISPNFTPTSGYGRLDPVQTYSTTTRKVNCSFTIISTSKEDFNDMWYKINKITTLLYPQWSEGTKVSNGPGRIFTQPFSQVLAASPIVRLRIGDIIKSNYSKFNLARIFGIGDKDTVVGRGDSSERDANIASTLTKATKSDGVFKSIQEVMVQGYAYLFGSITQYNDIFKDQINNNFLKGVLSDVVSTAENALASNFSIMKNSFVNPLVGKLFFEQLIDPNASLNVFNNTNINEVEYTALEKITNDITGYNSFKFFPNIFPLMLKSNNNTGYLLENGKVLLTTKNIDVIVLEKTTKNNRIKYKIQISDPTSEYNGETLIVDHGQLLADPLSVFNSDILTQIYGALSSGPQAFEEHLNKIYTQFTLNKGIPIDASQTLSNIYSELSSNEIDFMKSENNPFVRAYESTAGKGLAGVLGGISFNWLSEIPWEIDYNSRAPMGCKITFALDVIHDIPPGLDHSGYNRAPLYNVGDIMNNIGGSIYDDNNDEAKINFKVSRQSRIKNE